MSMVEYLLATDEQRELAELAGTICEKELRPQIEALEEANGGVGEYPWDVHHKLADAGFYTMNMPQEWGGLGLDSVTRGLILEEMSKTDCGFPFSFRGLGDKFNLILNSKIPESDKKMWIEKMLAGKAGGAFCLTEAGAGSDSKAIRTSAVKDGDEWVINGTKCFITNGPIADFYGVFAWTDKSVSAGKGITCFLVEKERGIQVAKVEKKMGFKLSPTAELVMEDVRVPEDHIVGELGRGFSTAMGTLDEARPFNSVFAIGAAQRAVDEAKKYANERMTFGKYIIAHQGIGFKLAEMQMKVDAARAMTYYALRVADRGIPIGRLGSEAKAQPTELCQQVAVDAIQVLGGYGYMKEYPLEKIMRDMRLFTIFGGTNEVQKIIISRTMKAKH
jgi:butyryl-CoA dehydrogenase